MKFTKAELKAIHITKAELKVIHTNLFHHLAILDAVSMLENGGEKDNTKEAKIIKSILNKISKHRTLPTAHHD